MLEELKNLKSTTQNAPLEKILAKFRAQRVSKYVAGKRVLDFGCGKEAWTANTISPSSSLVHGVDASVKKAITFSTGITVFPSLEELPRADYETIIALAVFEHIDPFELVDILNRLSTITTVNGIIAGTVPTPSSRRILEFLSYKLKLIDQSQIKDHKAYYDDLWLNVIAAKTPWKVTFYKRFQLGLNSQFLLTKSTF